MRVYALDIQNKTKVKKLPQQMLKKMSFPFTVDTVLLTDSRLIYTEKDTLYKKPLQVELGNLNAKILERKWIITEIFKI